jgi:hypothetical protein
VVDWFAAVRRTWYEIGYLSTLVAEQERPWTKEWRHNGGRETAHGRCTAPRCCRMMMRKFAFPDDHHHDGSLPNGIDALSRRVPSPCSERGRRPSDDFGT